MITNWVSRLRFLCLPLMVAIPAFAPRVAFAQNTPEEEFKAVCKACHYIGGGKFVGPDLKGIAERRDPKWIIKFLCETQKVLKEDSIGQKLLKEYGFPMPPPAGMTPESAKAIIEFITVESKLPRSRFAKPLATIKPFTDKDRALGRALFLGAQRFSGGAPACVSCHDVIGTGLLGGGRFGPDLTGVWSRKITRDRFRTWLKSPDSPVMKTVLGDAPLEPDETTALLAYFESISGRTDEPRTPSMVLFVLLGLVGSGAVLAVSGALSRKSSASPKDQEG